MKNTLTKINGKAILVGILFLVVAGFSGCSSTDDYVDSGIKNNSQNTDNNSKSTKTQPSTKQSIELLELIRL